MKLFIYRHPSGIRNFGDELGAVVFPALLPGCFDDDSSSLFLGIGSVLFDNLPAARRTIVLGAGFGGYTRPPRIDSRWTILGVRGPLTCRALGLSESLAIGDPAMLLRRLRRPRAGVARYRCSFMPHWQTLLRGDWRAIAAAAGLHLIDPRDPVDQVLEEIEASDLVIAEAMHGAIVADALRVPWIALRPIDPIHRFKWQDWAQSLGIALDPQRLAASGLGERLAVIRLGRRTPLRRVAGYCSPLLSVGAARLMDRAVASLRRAAAAPPCLSADAALERAVIRQEEAIERFRREQGFPA